MQNITGKELYQLSRLGYKPEVGDTIYDEAQLRWRDATAVDTAVRMVEFDAKQRFAAEWNTHKDAGKVIHIRYTSGLRKGSVYRFVNARFVKDKYGTDRNSFSELTDGSVKLSDKKRERALLLRKEQDEFEVLFDYDGDTVEYKNANNIELPDVFDDNAVQINIDDYALGTYREYVPGSQGQYRTHFTLLKLKKITPKMITLVDDKGIERRGERASFALYRIKLDSVLASAAALSDANILDIAEISLTLKV